MFTSKDSLLYLSFLRAATGLLAEPSKPKNPNAIGQGLELIPNDAVNKESKSSKDYCNLFKDGKMISPLLFRRGGLFSGFKDQKYCQILAYPKFPKETWGDHVIIDTDGNIVLRGTGLEYPYYLKGVIATIKNKYYNLLIGQLIVEGSSSVKSENYLFVENSYSFGEYAKYEKGVYKIDYWTGNFEIIK